MKYNVYIVFLAIVILVSGCGTGNKFASSFGKRKYNKGYYWDVPSHAVAIKAANNPIQYTNEQPIKARSFVANAEKSATVNQVQKQVEQAYSIIAARPEVEKQSGLGALAKIKAIEEKYIQQSNGDGRHITDTKVGASTKGASGTAFTFFILALASLVAAIIVSLFVEGAAYDPALFDIVVGILALGIILDIIAFIIALIAVIRGDKKRGLAWIVIGFNVLLGLLFSIFLLEGDFY
jgi:hypothetical protein